MICHITTSAHWQKAIKRGFYETDSLQSEGFIHCCKKEQVDSVIKRYYSEIKHLMIIDINEARLSSDIVYELSPAVDEMFPHVYGVINLDAVETIHPVTT